MLQLLITKSYLESFIGENYEEQKDEMVRSVQVDKWAWLHPFSKNIASLGALHVSSQHWWGGDLCTPEISGPPA